MFCKNCGKEIEDDAKFCPECGTAQSAAKVAKNKRADSDSPEKDDAARVQGASNGQAESHSKQGGAFIDEVSNENFKNTNSLCIAGLILTILTLFVNTYGLVGFAALILSFLGYKAAKKNGQKGTMIAIVCMAVAGITTLIFVIRLIEYQRYESAVYGGVSGFFEWLLDNL